MQSPVPGRDRVSPSLLEIHDSINLVRHYVVSLELMAGGLDKRTRGALHAVTVVAESELELLSDMLDDLRGVTHEEGATDGEG
ncbi:hypothetical protein [Methylobrevis pamukkalensis]|uniref:Uncharacterized protein n=1 Tax=Methylobrevis pamukkalensis TaxID=1439726 RepID=A0A1E3GNK3_9HYPH|nr:hypothetical protein [Methylobrevis pamukkalensis]ODN65614.1 hypothetical protein A6302_04511 [Methylobrevis pamukkalensis]